MISVFVLARTYRELADKLEVFAYELQDELIANYLDISLKEVQEAKLSLIFCADCGYPLDDIHSFSDCNH